MRDRDRGRTGRRLIGGLAAVALVTGACTTATASPSSASSASPTVWILSSLPDEPSPIIEGTGSMTPARSVSAGSPTPSATLVQWAQPTSDPVLENVLPDSVDGIKLQKASARASNLIPGGDLCLLICSRAPAFFLQAMPGGGVEATMALGMMEKNRNEATVAIAIRVPGAQERDLIPAWVRAMRLAVTGDPTGAVPDPIFKSAETTIGKKHVTVVSAVGASVWAIGSAEQVEYLYARANVLFVIIYMVADAAGTAMKADPVGSPPPTVSDLIAALPTGTIPAAATPSPFPSEPERDPALESMMPATVDQFTLSSLSFPAVSVALDRNSCMSACPYGGGHLFDALPSGARDGASAVLTEPNDSHDFPVFIVAFRIPRVQPADLIPAYTKAVYETLKAHATGNPQPPESTTAVIGGRSVTVLRYGDKLGPDGGVEYLRTVGNVLIVVMYDPGWEQPEMIQLFADPTHPGPRLAHAIAALP